MRIPNYSFLETYHLPAQLIENYRVMFVTEERIKTWKEIYPQAMEKLQAIRLEEDVIFSHKTEGMTLPKEDLSKILMKGDRVTELSSMKALGLAEAIARSEDMICKEQISVEDVVSLHEIMLRRYDKNAGEFHTNVNPHVGFGTATLISKPASLNETSFALKKILSEYNHSFNEMKINRHILAMCTPLDLFSVSPFNNGNGRIFHLCLYLFLRRSEIEFIKYSSLNKQIYTNLHKHIKSIQESTDGWEGTFNGYDQFICHMFDIMNSCANELNKCFPDIVRKISKSERIRYVVSKAPNRFSRVYIEKHAPDISTVMIKQELSKMISEGLLEKNGKTRGTSYIKT